MECIPVVAKQSSLHLVGMEYAIREEHMHDTTDRRMMKGNLFDRTRPPSVRLLAHLSITHSARLLKGKRKIKLMCY